MGLDEPRILRLHGARRGEWMISAGMETDLETVAGCWLVVVVVVVAATENRDWRLYTRYYNCCPCGLRNAREKEAKTQSHRLCAGCW